MTADDIIRIVREAKAQGAARVIVEGDRIEIIFAPPLPVFVGPAIPLVATFTPLPVVNPPQTPWYTPRSGSTTNVPLS